MSSDTEVPVSNLHDLRGVIHELQPLLEYDEAFVLKNTPCGGDQESNRQIRGPLARAITVGALERIEKKRTDGSWRWEYRWVPEARDRLLDYIDDMDTLPCGCRCHLPDSRDDPDGRVSCNYCGEEYDEDWFKAYVGQRL